MQTLELSHYPRLEHRSKVTSVQKETIPLPPTQNIQTSLENTINSIFAPQTEETKVTRTRKHLGAVGKTFSDEQIETTITEFQFLMDTWLDEYEREVFNGFTLKEVLNEG